MIERRVFTHYRMDTEIKKYCHPVLGTFSKSGDDVAMILTTVARPFSSTNPKSTVDE